VLLADKIAVVYGAAGPIGTAIAHAFAREGASVHLAGRTAATLDTVAADIRATGGRAEIAVVDALDEHDVDAFVDDAVRRAGRLDISVNVVAIGDVQRPLTDLSAEEFVQPVATALRTQFLTTRAAVRHMIPRRTGVILAFGGSGPQTIPGMGGAKVAFDAVESHRRQWTVEVSQYGIRVVTLKTGGIPESIPADFPGRAEIVAGLDQASPLGRTATLADVGNVAAFVASDLAGTMTGSEVNISCGAILD
jgi:3-oxoacyl-[acyl-carrier protein] reductase